MALFFNLAAARQPLSWVDRLDGRSRGKRTNYAFVANKGSWQDNGTFVLERRFLGNGEMVYWSIQCEGEQLNLRFKNTDGYETEL